MTASPGPFLRAVATAGAVRGPEYGLAAIERPADPADRDAAFARMRAYLPARPGTAGGGVLPLVTGVLRALRR